MENERKQKENPSSEAALEVTMKSERGLDILVHRRKYNQGKERNEKERRTWISIFQYYYCWKRLRYVAGEMLLVD